jgi:alkylhydroperoxidase/carboxymuconolactone decarboxylase family protein YurZ
MKEGSGGGRVANFMRFEYVSGSLDTKTRELVLLASAAVAGCAH